MSFGLPAIKPIPSGPETFGPAHHGVFGLPDPLLVGRESHKNKLGASHPVELSEKNFRKNQHQMSMAMLRSTQGLHAPMKLAMELRCVGKAGHLPCLPGNRSNLLEEVLTGRDTEISFDDILNIKEHCEFGGQPHAMIEKSLGIL